MAVWVINDCSECALCSVEYPMFCPLNRKFIYHIKNCFASVYPNSFFCFFCENEKGNSDGQEMLASTITQPYSNATIDSGGSMPFGRFAAIWTFHGLAFVWSCSIICSCLDFILLSKVLYLEPNTLVLTFLFVCLTCSFEAVCFCKLYSQMGLMEILRSV